MHLGAASSDTQAFADRKTYVLDEEGRLRLRYDSVSVSPHPQEVLDDVTLLLENP